MAQPLGSPSRGHEFSSQHLHHLTTPSPEDQCLLAFMTTQTHMTSIQREINKIFKKKRDEIHIESHKLLTFLHDKLSSVFKYTRKVSSNFSYFVCAHAHAMEHTCGSQFSPSTVRVPGIKVKCEACGKHLHLLSHPAPPYPSLSITKLLNYFNIFLLRRVSRPLNRLLYVLFQGLALLYCKQKTPALSKPGQCRIPPSLF